MIVQKTQPSPCFTCLVQPSQCGNGVSERERVPCAWLHYREVCSVDAQKYRWGNIKEARQRLLSITFSFFFWKRCTWWFLGDVTQKITKDRWSGETQSAIWKERKEGRKRRGGEGDLKGKKRRFRSSPRSECEGREPAQSRSRGGGWERRRG